MKARAFGPFVVGVLASCVSGCTQLPPQQAPPVSRWQVIPVDHSQGGNNVSDKGAVLLDTQTGDTWHDYHNSETGYRWERMPRNP